MGNPIPDNFKKIWDKWNIRGVILLSLSLQTILILIAPFRKGTANKLLIMLIWSAYLLADSAATFAVGLISNSQRDAPDSGIPAENNDLLAFWAPFLLLHLGGPDTITAFALEDNELWLRHLLGLVSQAVATLYVFLLSLPRNKLYIPTILMFIAGILKYYERTRALYLASLDRFRDSMLEDPDPGPNYAKLMEEYASKKEANLPAKIITISEIVRESKAKGVNEGKTELNYSEVVQYAYEYFNIFKGLIVDLILSFRERDKSRALFRNLKPEHALRVIEVELNFVYEVFYTKVEVINSVPGYVVRLISVGSVVAALLFFRFEVKRQHLNQFDVRITHTLLLGAICLDIISLLMHVFSDWTLAAFMEPKNKSRPGKIKSSLADILSRFLILKKPRWRKCQTQHSVKLEHEVLATSFLLRRWAGSVSGHNLVRYCLKGCPSRVYIVKSRLRLAIEEVTDYLGIADHYIRKMIADSLYKKKAFQKIANKTKGVIHFLCIDKFYIFLAKWSSHIHTGLGSIINRIIFCFGLNDFFDEIRYVSREPLAKELWEFIYEELKSKAFGDDAENPKKIYSARGEWILQKCDPRVRSELMTYVADVAYDESLLMWHIATELLYHDDEEDGTDKKDYNINARVFSKILSDYMLYLLVMQPAMMSSVAGIGKIRFRDTCAEARRFFKGKGLKPSEEKEACKRIISVNTDVKPVSVKGDRSKSVLFDASELAKQLKRLEEEDEEVEEEKKEEKKKEDKWVLVSKVWVELLSFAASHCTARTHAQQVSKGGELITFVWLLMAHFGLGNQFQISKGQERAKLIVGK